MGMEVGRCKPYRGAMATPLKPPLGSEANPRFFRSGAEFRRWLERNHAREPAIWIGFWTAPSGKKGITYLEAVDESLCFGWIDGVLRSHGKDSYQQRYTPRRARSIWSAINLRKIEALRAAGRLAPAGIAAHAGRDPKRASLYSTENRHVTLAPAFEKRFRAKKLAWKFFEAQPPGYRRLAAFWVMKAVKEETRERRFASLLEDSAAGKRSGAVTGD